MLIDIHCHNDPANTIIRAQQAHQMRSTISATSKAEYQKNAQVVTAGQKLSYGVHPWQSQTEGLDRELLKMVALIGEIGLDTVWTDVPLPIQRPLFQQQLAFAAAQHRQVVLHVKGCEQECLAAIQQVPQIPKLVHWYSSQDYLTSYLQIPNTWFSVGPDLWKDPAVENVARTVPLNRLFIESDGFEGMAWALDQEVAGERYYQILQKMMETIAQWRSISVGELETQFEKNWDRFWNS